MKKKGFTLIELLAVIVILAIIALIATPTILNVIEKARKGATEQSALGYIDAIEKQVAINQVKGENLITDGIHDIPISDVTVKGETPTKGWVTIEKGIVTNYSFVIGKYVVTKDEKVEKGEEPATKPSGTVETTYTVYPNGTAIYYNPETNSKCDSSEAVSTTGTKTGCMKWYTFNDEGSNSSTVNMILDHNTTATVVWNAEKKNVAYENSNIKPEVDKLVSESKWVSIPRLITAEEINKIVGKTGWTNTSGWYCFESKKQDLTSYPLCNNTGTYGWLYDHTHCKEGSNDWRCNNNDTKTDGYWTSTTYGTAGSGGTNWSIDKYGNLGLNTSNYTGRGVRPVITISKSIIS